MKLIRIDKYLADMGIGTRTEIKGHMKKGLVSVDGVVVKKPETKVDAEGSSICFRGQPVNYTEYEYFLFYKPAGCVSATEDNVHETVLDYIDSQRKKDLFPVGRLDLDTEGLLLLTNDGALAHALLSPRKHVAKTYYARIDQPVTDQDIHAFHSGLDIGEKRNTLPAELKRLSDTEVEITITEGKFHQIKRMFEAVGKEVLYLKRIQMGSLCLDERMEPGEYRPLTEAELMELRG